MQQPKSTDKEYDRYEGAREHLTLARSYFTERLSMLLEHFSDNTFGQFQPPTKRLVPVGGLTINSTLTCLRACMT